MNSLKLTPRRFSTATSVVLTLLLAVPAYFFLIATSRSNYPSAVIQAVSSWTYYLFLLALFFLMQYTGEVSRYRRIFFVAFAFLFVPTFIANLYEMRGSMALTSANIVNSETPFCHIVIPLSILPYAFTKTVIFPARLNNHYASVYSMLIIWLAATLTIGKGWCSWVCFYGGFDEGFSRVRRGKKPVVNIDNPDEKLRKMNYIVLAFTALVSLATLTVIYCEWFCPFKMVTEFSEITDLRSLIATVIFILLFFGLAVVLPILTRKRTQCSLLCPFGAFQSLAGKISPYRIRIDTEKCTKCMKCVKECPLLAIRAEDIEKGTGKMLATCSLCGVCVDVCPQGAIEYRMPLFDSKQPGGIEKLRGKIRDPKKGFGKFIDGMLRVLEESLSPRALFAFTAFLMGAVISSGFGTGTIYRLINFFVNGSFTLG